MSHFSCLVIGEDVEGQLEPHDENTSVAPYKAYWDSDTIERWERILREPTTRKRTPAPTKDDPFHQEEEEVLYPPEQVLSAGDYSLEDMRKVYMARYHGYEAPPADYEPPEGFELDDSELEDKLFIDDGGIYEWSTYNPKSKWDWWEIGGRWRGYFKLKAHAKEMAIVGRPGVFKNEAKYDSDEARKGDIDIEWMRDKAERDAADAWDRVHAVIGGLPPVKGWEEHYVAGLMIQDQPGGEPFMTVDEARKEYHEQPAVKAFEEWNGSLPDEERVKGWFGPNVEDFQVPREQFIDEARMSVLCPYAYVMEGEWYAPGKMGWFGSSTETKNERKKFEREFNELLDSLPDDTLLTLCDLHI